MPALAIAVPVSPESLGEKTKSKKMKKADAEAAPELGDVVGSVEKKKKKSKKVEADDGAPEGATLSEKKKKKRAGSDDSSGVKEKKRKASDDEGDKKSAEKLVNGGPAAIPNGLPGKKQKISGKENGELASSGSTDEQAAADPNAVSNFRISEPLRAALKSKGIQSLFPIQAMTFDLILDGSDLVGRARTGQVWSLSLTLISFWCLVLTPMK